MKLILILLTFFTSIVYSQNIKTYSGKYNSESKSRFNDFGTATYNYFENKDSERIKDGKFIFKGTKLNIVGQFKNGLRNGLWNITYNFTPNSSYFKPYVINLTANYIDGKLNGDCTYLKTSFPSKSIIEKSTATFKNNLLVGEYLFIQNIGESGSKSKILIKYFQNQDGELNGEYRTEFHQSCCQSLGQIEDVINYEKGVMKYRLCREKEDGKVYYKFENGIYTKSLENESTKSVFSSTWDVYIGCDFWIGREDKGYNGIEYNPLYSFTEGINMEGFKTIEERLNL